VKAAGPVAKTGGVGTGATTAGEVGVGDGCAAAGADAVGVGGGCITAGAGAVGTGVAGSGVVGATFGADDATDDGAQAPGISNNQISNKGVNLNVRIVLSAPLIILCHYTR
jgi:hypothetical protein